MNKNQRVMLTKRLLQEALIRLLEKKPLEKISITELCEEADINRATFYRHYNLPCEVLEEMQSMFVEKIHSDVDMNALISSPLKYVEKVCSYIYDYAEIVKIFINNNSEENMIKLFDDFFESLLRNNERIKRSYNMDESEIKLISAYMSGGGYFMLRRWLLEDIPKTSDEVSKLVLSFFNQV